MTDLAVGDPVVFVELSGDNYSATVVSLRDPAFPVIDLGHYGVHAVARDRIFPNPERTGADNG